MPSNSIPPAATYPFNSHSTTAPHQRNWIWGPVGVVKHELIRTLTFGRISTWLFMAMFPPLLVGIATWQIGSRGPGLSSSEMYFGSAFLMFILMPQVLTVLGMVLWATPIVYSELEAQTWVYAVVRPGARRGVLIGKYCVAVLWTLSAATVATTLSVPLSRIANSFHTWVVLCGLNLIAAIAYGALFLLIGTLIQKRAMVTAFIYAFLVEAIISTLPATVNVVTVSYRLRAIFFQALDLKVGTAQEIARIFDTQTSMSMHMLCLSGLVLLFMGIATWRVQATQFIWQSEV